jgi:hypothetical protein
MPKAFSIAHGLDWETEISSYWAWLQDTRDVIEGRDEPDSLVRELVADQRTKIEELASKEADPAAARLTLAAAVAMVGFHHASIQKLVDGLQREGVFQHPRELPAFDTVAAPAVED